MANEVSILITGDFYGGNRIETLIKENSYEKIYNDFLPLIRNCDIAISNLESALTNSSGSISKTGPAIKAIPQTIEALKFAGFNVLTLANNHIMDFGAEGLNDTIQNCLKNNIQYLGAGHNLNEASATLFLQKQNTKFAIINIAENEFSSTHGLEPGANPLDPVSNFYQIQQAKKQADFVFVVVHGGHEMHSLPSVRMKQTYRFFADAGADAIIGHHTHCYSGYEMYKNSMIFYGLGNFIFDNPSFKNSKWNYGYAVQFCIENNILNFKLIPYEQCNIAAGTFLLKGEKLHDFETELARLNKIIERDELLLNEFESYCKTVSRSYNAFIEPHSNKYLHGLRNRGLFPSLWSRRKKLFLLNLMRCESHRDVLINILHR